MAHPPCKTITKNFFFFHRRRLGCDSNPGLFIQKKKKKKKVSIRGINIRYHVKHRLERHTNLERRTLSSQVSEAGNIREIDGHSLKTLGFDSLAMLQVVGNGPGWQQQYMHMNIPCTLIGQFKSCFNTNHLSVIRLKCNLVCEHGDWFKSIQLGIQCLFHTCKKLCRKGMDTSKILFMMMERI